jgi:ATP-dependent Lon protease
MDDRQDMSSSNQSDHSLPDGFANEVRLFPLPNLVLFPGVVQALHLFEPRYRALAADALAADELITMAFIKPDWNFESDEKPEIAETVCVGKILSHTQLDDGRYNMFLVGTQRARILAELSQGTPYRMAEVEILEDVIAGAANIPALRRRIMDSFRDLAALRSGWNHDALSQFLDDDLPFGQLVDMICYSCGASPVDQQRVLEATELGNRGELVLGLVKQQIESSRNESDASQSFPPGFSLN